MSWFANGLKNVPKEFIPEDYQPPINIRNKEEHANTLKDLDFIDPKEIEKVISKFESVLADPLNFPMMPEDLGNLPPAYFQASEYKHF